MSTLAEIESAIEQLTANDVTALRKWLDDREAALSPLAKWEGMGTGVVKQSGGVDAFLRNVRGERVPQNSKRMPPVTLLD